MIIIKQSYKMNKIIFLTILLLGLKFQILSQPYFQKTFGTSSDETSMIIKKLSNGNFLCAGNTNINGDTDISFIELDQNFQQIWTNTTGTTGKEEDVYDIIELSSGNIISIGRQIQGANQKTIIVASNNIGTFVSSTSLGSHHDRFRSFFETIEGDFILWGELEGAITASGNRVALIKYDNNMNILNKIWINPGGSENSITNNFEMYGRAMRQLPDSSYIICSHFNDQNTVANDQMRLIKLDKSLNLTWIKGYWGTDHLNVSGMVPLQGGDIIFYGKTLAYSPAGGHDMWVSKIDGTGNHIWTKTYGTANEETLVNGIENQAGNIIITGYTDGVGFGGEDIVTMEIDTSGNIIWAKAYGGLANERPSRCIESNSGYIVTGQTNSFGAGGNDFYLLNMDLNGNVNDTCNMDISSQLIIGTTGIPTEYTRSYSFSTFSSPTALFLNNTSVTFFDTTACMVCQTTQLIDSSICQGDSILLQGNYQTTSGIYNDTLTSVIGCDSIVSTSLTVNTIPYNILTDSICQGDSILFNGIWQNSSGIYNDTIYNGSSNGCDSIVELTLTVLNSSNASIISIDSIFCKNDPPVNLLSISSGGTWTGSGITDPITGTFSPGLLSAGSYEVIYAISGICGDADTINIIINENPVITSSIKNDSCHLEIGSIDLSIISGISPYTYNWSNNSASEDLSGLISGIYIVTVTDSNQCSVSETIFIDDLLDNCSGNLWLPNVFSPNSDGLNDVFKVLGADLSQSFIFCIYDRWGEKVFETTDPHIGWDGTYQGKAMNSAVFAYRVEATFIDGSSGSLSGTVTLVK